MFLFVPLTRLHCYELNTCLMIIFFFEPFPIGYFHWNGTFSNRYCISILKANTHTHSHLINSINLNTREKKKQSKQNKRKLGSPFRLFCSNLFSVMFCRILATVYITCFPTLSLTLSLTPLLPLTAKMWRKSSNGECEWLQFLTILDWVENKQTI